eukprot:scaffold94169_cov62-Attheya_sp.AAC.4
MSNDCDIQVFNAEGEAQVSNYEWYQDPCAWFDLGTVVSFQIVCHHYAHNEEISLFTHFGDPKKLNDHGYSISSNSNINTILSEHIGVLFSLHHFAVIDFNLDHQIILIHDGLNRPWKNEIRNILQNDLSIMGD